ncbi:hypothetical protein HELRODRAFT_97204 [Helobdella robusta]|uniref:Protein kinase domain-containing protein n=1 Tax=Helobdella robusta TaxID=6412 RepID=T1G9G0_HELRO|nr:hypothetical protein HELRODRAFT_97204 [Helobdella robusta]ESO11044.1 hypothetical protein HELRODRAFT_97204 [Helobdella robusta]
MNRLKHKNIASLVGICVDEFPYCIATEYLTNGDLKRFLQHYEVIHPDTCDPERNTISSNVLSFFSYQISCGMEYLESLNLVHRDLATRNCLVGERGHVKISDFGMSKCLHSSDYYQIQGIAVLPIRWMAWESLFLGKFSTASDVWSFGVTLWEVMTLAKHQPFDELTDEQVIENSQRCFYENLKLSNRQSQEAHLAYNSMDDFQPFLLAQPLNCPSKFYNLMLSCWSTDPASRPRFLQLKNTMRSTFDVDLVTRDVTLLDEFTSSKMRNECFSLDNRKRTIISNSTLSSPVFD